MDFYYLLITYLIGQNSKKLRMVMEKFLYKGNKTAEPGPHAGRIPPAGSKIPSRLSPGF